MGSKDYFKIFTGNQGVLPGQSAVNWLANKGVGLAVVDPDNGIPDHFFIVGSAARIPFEFQYTLDMQWSAGPISIRPKSSRPTRRASSNTKQRRPFPMRRRR